MSRRPPRIRSFDQALKAVGHASASESHAHALFRIFKGELMSVRPQFQQTFNELKDETSRKMHVLQDRAAAASRRAAHAMDEEAHREPWIFVGIAALFAGIFGFLVGWKARR